LKGCKSDKLRFVGDEQMRLENVCIVFTDGDWIESKDQSESGIRLIQTGNIGEGQYLEKETRAKFISKDTFDRLKCTEIFAGDILVSRLPEPVGRACIIPQKNERMITAVDCTICRPNEEIVNKEYLCYFMRSSAYYNRLLGSVTGTTRKRISRKNLGNVELDVPSLSEQKSVVERLNCLVNIMCARQQELQKLDDLIKARFVEMFGSVRNNKYNYKIVTLQDVCEPIKDGTHKTPTYTDDCQNGYKFMSSKDVTSGKIDWEHLKYIPEELHKELYSRISPHKGDILLAKNGTTGIAAVVDRDEIFDIYVSLALLRPVKTSPIYLWAAVNAYETKVQFNASLKGIGVPNLHLGEIKKVKLLLPPMELQNQFAAFVAQVDKSKVAVQKALDETQLLFDSLMQEYFG
jgi:type I restriction enzyme S subunit